MSQRKTLRKPPNTSKPDQQRELSVIQKERLQKFGKGFREAANQIKKNRKAH